jgi:DNA-binding GntR family transcriptional regulator
VTAIRGNNAQPIPPPPSDEALACLTPKMHDTRLIHGPPAATQRGFKPVTMSAAEPAAKPRSIGRTGLTNQVYEALKEQILDQTVTPGGRINIDQLVVELGVSSTPIREALARLHAARLVTFEPYIGYSAAPIHEDAWFHDMIDFRAMIEGSAARIGAPRAEAGIVARLRQAFADMAGAGLGQHYRKYARFNVADAEFHQAVVASAGNRIFIQVYKDLQPHVHYARLYLNRGEQEEESRVAAEHRAILDAFINGDGPAAHDAVIAHLEAARSRLLKSAAFARSQAGEIGRPKKR